MYSRNWVFIDLRSDIMPDILTPSCRTISLWYLNAPQLILPKILFLLQFLRQIVVCIICPTRIHFIIFSIFQIFHELRDRITNLDGNGEVTKFFYINLCCAQSVVGTAILRGLCEVRDTVSEINCSLRIANNLHCTKNSVRNNKCRRLRKADIFTRKNNHSSRDKLRILASFHHARQIIECGIWLRSEEHTSELQSQSNLVCRLLLEKTE